MIENVAEVFPARTVTLTGTCASALLLDKETVTPPTGAAEVKFTVPVLLAPPVTVLGAAERLWRVLG